MCGELQILYDDHRIAKTCPSVGERLSSLPVSLLFILLVNSIFMTQDLRRAFNEINQSLAEILINVEVGHQYPNPEFNDQTGALMKKISKQFVESESVVQKRLRYEEA